MLSESAKFEHLDQFKWYTYNGRPKTLVARKHERILEKGAVFGMKAIRGDKFYIIFPEDFHIDFTVTKRIGNNIVKNSKFKRKPPPLSDNKGIGGRASRTTGSRGHAQIQKSQEKFKWDATYFKPQGRVPDELKQGIDFANYQWRKVDDITPLRKRNGTNVVHTFAKKDVIGVRFLRDSKGGKLVTPDGKVFAIGKEQFDMMLNVSKLMPKNKWPEGTVTLDEMKENAEHEKEAIKEKRINDRKEAKAQREAAKREKKNREREQRRQAKADEAAERERLARRLEGKKKQVELEMKPKSNKELADLMVQGKKPKEDEDLLSDDDLRENLDALKQMDLDSDEVQEFDTDEEGGEGGTSVDFDDTDLSDIDMPDPEDREIDDNESEKLMDDLDELIEQRHEAAFSLDGDDEDSDPDFDSDEEDELDDGDLDDGDEDPDAEDDGMDDPDFEEEEDLDVDDDPEADDGDGEENSEGEDSDTDPEDEDLGSDDEDVDSEDGESDTDDEDLDSEEDEDLDGGDDELDDEGGDDSEDPDEDFTDGDEDAEGDETDSGDDEGDELDSDGGDGEDFTDDETEGEPDLEDENAEADEEAAEQALDSDDSTEDEDAAAADDELGDEAPEDDDEDFDGVDEEEEDPEANPPNYAAEEGHVVIFRSDETSKREFVLLDIFQLPTNNNITVYKVYDVTNKPEEFNTVRVSKGSRNKFENMVKFVRQMNPKEFTKYYTEAEYMDRSKSPINS